MIRRLMASSAMLALFSAGAIGVASAQTQPVNPAQPPAVAQDQQNPATQPETGAAAPATEGATEPANDQPTAEIQPSERPLTPDQPTLATAFIGQPVFSNENQEADNIGEVNDLIISDTGEITHAVVGVGGFLGIGEKDVAVPFDELEIVEQEGDLRLIYAATREQLEQAQPFDRATYEPEGRAAQQQQQQAAQQNATGMGATGTAMDPATQPADTAATEPATNPPVNGASTDSAATQPAGGTTVVTVTPTTPQQTAQATQPAAGATPATTQQEVEGFMSFNATDQIRASTLMGQEIFGAENESIGEVSDLVVQPDGDTRAALIDVGGFLGIGEKQVAIPFDQIQMQQDGNEPRLTVAMTREQLEQAPAYEAPEEQQAAQGTAPAAGQQTAATQPADPAQPPAAGQPAAQQTAQEQLTPATQDMSAENLMGQAVYSSTDENLGQVDDVVFSQQGEIQAVVIDVGGFLGIGEKSVAINFDQLNVQKNTNGDLRIQVNATEEQLQAAPAYDVEQATAQ